MSHNCYSEIHLHVVWHTKESAPLLVPDVEEFTHRWIRQKLVNTEGAFIHAVGGTRNHIHLCVEIAPTILVSELIGQLKGASSHEVNQQFAHRGKVLQWQAGYGVVTFGRRDLPWVVGYIENQKVHHGQGSVHARLERIESPDG